MAWNFIATATQGFTSTGIVPISSFPYSISCWFYPTTTGAVQTLVSFAGSTATNNRIELQLTASGSCQAISQTATNNRAALTTNTVKPGWNHFFGLFYTATERFAMLNGGPGVNSSVNSPIVTPTRFAIGIDATSAGTNGLNGRLGELAIFNRRMSFQEMQYVARGNSVLLLENPDGALRFYRNFDKSFHDAELGDYDKIKMTPTSSSPRPAGSNNFQKKFATSERVVDIAVALLLAPAITVTNIALDAIAVGVVTMTRQIGSVSGVVASGVTAFVRQVADNLNATGVGITGSVFSASKTLAVTATGVVALTVTRVTQIVLAAVALGVTTFVKQAQLVSAATATGVTAFVRGVATSLNSTAVGITGSMFSAAKTLGATAVGVAGITVSSVFNQTLAVVAIGVTAITMQVSKLLAAVGIGVATMSESASTAATATSTEQPGPYLGGGGIGLYGRYGAARRFAKRRRK